MLVSEIPFDSEIGLEGVEMLRQDKNLLSGHTIRFAVSRRKKKPVGGYTGERYLDSYRSQPCHGILRQSGPFEMCATGINPKKMDGMHEYFVKHSPFSRFVLNRDSYVKDGFIAITGDLWYPFQNCLNIFCRQSAEGFGEYMQSQFDDFISKSVPPILSLLIVTSTNMYNDGLPDTTNVAFKSCHSLVAALTIDGVRNFLSADAAGYPKNSDNRPTIKPTDFYKGVYTWEEGTRSPSPRTDWLYTIFKENETEITRGRGLKKSLSPFADNANTNFPSVRRNEFNAYALPYLLDVYAGIQSKDRIPTPSSRDEASTGPSGEAVRKEGYGNSDAVQEHGNAFARAVGVRN